MKIRFSYVSGGVHPVVGEVLYPVQQVSDGPEGVRYQRYLASPIGSVARDKVSCERLLRDISRVQTGESESIEVDSDDVELVLSPLGVQCNITVSDEWTDNPEGFIELRLWQLALEGWLRFLSLPKSLESVVEVELDFT